MSFHSFAGRTTWSVLVEDDQPVLLAADPMPRISVLRRAEAGDDFADGLFGGVDPVIRVLFHCAGREVRDEAVGSFARKRGFPRFPSRGRWFLCFVCRSRCRERSWRRGRLKDEDYASPSRADKELLSAFRRLSGKVGLLVRRVRKCAAPLFPGNSVTVDPPDAALSCRLGAWPSKSAAPRLTGVFSTTF